MDDDALAYYLGQLHQVRSAASEQAYMTLLTHITPANVPSLITAFDTVPNLIVKADLIEIIWQQRLPETLHWLENLLQNYSGKIWLKALDGVVAIGTPLAAKILNEANLGCPTLQRRMRTKWSISRKRCNSCPT